MLITETNLSSPDDFYEALIETHRDLTNEQSQELNAALILLLANHLGARGEEIPAGTMILSGGITEAVAVKAGDNVTLRVQGMGSCSLRFV